MNQESTASSLAPGTPVWCSDGRIGRLADVVFDRAAGRVTDLVVEPLEKYRPMRLVPLWMVQHTDRGPLISLDQSHYARLQRVLEGDFIRTDTPASLVTDGWRIKFATCLEQPYFDATDAMVRGRDVTVPIGECAIRCGATVMGAKGNFLGLVTGFAVHGTEIVALIVRTGAFGQGRDVAVSFDVIIGDPGDVVFLSISADEFRQLPETDIVPRGSEVRGFVHRQQDQASGTFAAALDRVRGMFRDRDEGKRSR